MALFGRGKSILGLDIGSTAVKAVELSLSGGGLVISGMGSAEIDSPETVGDAVQLVLREAGIKTKRTVSSVSGRSVIFRQVSMMQMGEADLRQAVEYEADKYIPFEVGEVQLDAQRLEDGGADSEAGQMKVLLVAVKKALIEDHISLLQSIGLTPAIVDVDVFAIGNAFELRNLSLGIADEEVRALVDIGASKTNINIMRGNKSYFHREIYVAGNDLTDAVAKRFGEDPKDVEKMKKDPGGALESMQDAMLPVLEDIGNEIKLSFDYYENQYDQVVKEVYLSGGTVYFPGIDTMLSQIFSLPTKIWDPTEGLEITNFTPGGMGGSNSDMAIALGLASRLLGTVGKVSSVAPAPRTGDAEDRAIMDTKPPDVVAPPTTPSTSNWVKGIATGFGISAAIAAALLFLNVKGYEYLWVILEGIPLGLAAGGGLWLGIKSVRPLPTRAGIVFSSLAMTLLCCGGLLAGRFAMEKPMKKQRAAKKFKMPTNMKIPDLPGETQKQLVALREAAAQKQTAKKGVDIDDITAIIYILAHWMLAAFCAIQLTTFNLRKVEREERAVAL